MRRVVLGAPRSLAWGAVFAAVVALQARGARRRYCGRKQWTGQGAHADARPGRSLHTGTLPAPPRTIGWFFPVPRRPPPSPPPGLGQPFAPGRHSLGFYRPPPFQILPPPLPLA